MSCNVPCCAVAPSFKSFAEFEVEGNDIPCNGKPVCKLCEKADQMTSDKAKVGGNIKCVCLHCHVVCQKMPL